MAPCETPIFCKCSGKAQWHKHCEREAWKQFPGSAYNVQAVVFQSIRNGLFHIVVDVALTDLTRSVKQFQLQLEDVLTQNTWETAQAEADAFVQKLQLRVDTLMSMHT